MSTQSGWKAYLKSQLKAELQELIRLKAIALAPKLKQRYRDRVLSQLRECRWDTEISQADLDDVIGVCNGLVAKWETAVRFPTLFSAFCWAEALGMEIKLVKKGERDEAG